MRTVKHHYQVGALLYCPALEEGIVDKILKQEIPSPFSLCLCLEDTIGDLFLEQAICTLVKSLQRLQSALDLVEELFLPKIYIRVREAAQISVLAQRLGEAFVLVDGFVAPKISPKNLPDYVEEIARRNAQSVKPCYFMPILESRELLDLRSRTGYLYDIYEGLAPIAPLVASIRIGGTDLSHCLHLRRGVAQSIHEIPVISHLLSDIMAVFSMDYLVSGAVWEYYGGEHWAEGLQRELSQDKLGGFVGKTVIHPVQIPLVLQAYQVSATDYEDAKQILACHTEQGTWVSGSVTKERMNEYKTHRNWAEHILLLAEVYGIQEVHSHV